MKTLLILIVFAVATATCFGQYASSACGSSTCAAELNSKPAIQTGSAAASGNCTAGKDFWIDTTHITLQFCQATNTWSAPLGTIIGSSLTVGDGYYLSGATLTLAKADSASTLPGVCVAVTTTACVYSGTITNGSWTAGGLIYVSDSSAGALTQTIPTTSGHYVQVVGIATSTGAFLVMPSLNVAGIQ